MDPRSVETRLENYLRDHLLLDGTDGSYSRSVDLFARGYVDSVGFAELLACIEETYGIEVPEDDLLADEFSTVEGMARVIVRLRHDQVATGRVNDALASENRDH